MTTTTSTDTAFPTLHPANLIGGETVSLSGGDAVRSFSPSDPERTVWEGGSSTDDVQRAMEAARAAQPAWLAFGREKRAAALRAYADLCAQREEDVTRLITAETGKAMWEARGEAKLLAGKVATTLLEGQQSDGSGLARVTGYEIPLGETKRGVCSFRPHGVMAVVGPFNFPVHLPNGHMVPALLTGNTCVFKPSDKTPACGQILAEMMIEALDSVGAPKGVVNLVQGGTDVAKAVVGHDEPDGILFTGSWPVGRAILGANLDRPGRMIALEMGGNNPAIVTPSCDLRQAAIECARAAFATTGQRCTCTRRVIVHESIAHRFLGLLAKIASNLVVGDPWGVAGQQPFMGPIIRSESLDAALAFQASLAGSGGEVVVESSRMDSPTGGSYITPGIVKLPAGQRFTTGSTDPGRDAGCDAEVFGPILRASVYTDIDDAIDQANATAFGLAASIFSSDKTEIERFMIEARAGCVNVNTGTAGASGKLPFGGLGISGNHRPAGAFSLDYCAYPVASMVEDGTAAAESPGMLFDDSWL